MDPYSYFISSSNSSSSSSSPFSTYPQQQVEQKKSKVLPSYYSSLGIRRQPTKPMTKQPIAPLPPTPPKIYKVAPINFKEVVQMLTADPEFQSSSNSGSSSSSSSGSSFSTRRQAPPALDLSPVSLSRNGANNNNNDVAAQWREFLGPCSDQVESITTEQVKHVTPRIPLENNYFGSCSPLANFPLSPASFAWCSSILLSPGTLPSPNAVQLI